MPVPLRGPCLLPSPPISPRNATAHEIYAAGQHAPYAWLPELQRNGLSRSGTPLREPSTARNQRDDQPCLTCLYVISLVAHSAPPRTVRCTRATQAYNREACWCLPFRSEHIGEGRAALSSLPTCHLFCWLRLLKYLRGAALKRSSTLSNLPTCHLFGCEGVPVIGLHFRSAEFSPAKRCEMLDMT